MSENEELRKHRGERTERRAKVAEVGRSYVFIEEAGSLGV